MRLVIEDEAGTRSVVPFEGEAIVVGRGTEQVTFRLPERNVSRRHARFVLQAGAVLVEDLGSLNGTRVNGERISGRRRLRDGDLVQIGDYDLAVLSEEAVARPGAPPPLPPTAKAARPAAAASGPDRDPDAITQKLPLGPPGEPARPASAPPGRAAAPSAGSPGPGVPGALRAFLRWLKL